LNIKKLILRNLIYYRKKHFSVILGVMLSSTILIGALIIGDSVKYSLQRIVDKRLGKVQYAMTAGDRVFRQQLGNELSEKMNIVCSSILHTNGILIKDGGQSRLNNIQFYGVDRYFDKLSPGSTVYTNLSEDEIVVNSYIASKMNLVVGDELLLRFEKLDTMPKDSPLSDDSEITVAERFKIKSIADDEKFGRFGLKSEQIAPYNLFLPISKLASIMELENSANLLLVDPSSDNEIKLAEVNENLRRVWSIEDSGIKLEHIPDGSGIELRSNRVFIDNPIIEAASNSGINFSEVLTYFVNEISNRKFSTPYSFVTAISPELLSTPINKDEVIINNWAAEDLSAEIGSTLKLKYFIVRNNKKLFTDSSSLVVRKIVDIEGIYADKSLLPDYPGLAESESCLDWHPGIPIDFDKIRKKDENYWDKFKGTPKAFVSLDLAKEIWQNRFGKVTAIRFLTDDIQHVEKLLDDNINPLSWNIQFNDVRKAGLDASTHSVDFGGLFLGLSFFVIVSALLLTSILVLFNLESRTYETGLFLGLGLKNNFIKRIIFTEIGVLILFGSLLGCIVGIFYNNIILLALSTIWSDAVGTSSLEISVRPATIIIGFLIVVILNFLIVWLSLKRKITQNVHNLQRGISNFDLIKKNSNKYIAISITTFLAALILLVAFDPGKGSEVFGQYFFIGVLILVSGISLAGQIIYNSKTRHKTGSVSKFDLSLREITRKRSRSLLLITLLGSSLFIVFTVGINKKNVNENLLDNNSGTGGYTLIGETSIPVYKDLNDPKYRKTININSISGDYVRFNQMKVKSGDDASCLNLNRISNPQVVGVQSEEFLRKKAFTFSSFSHGFNENDSWALLDKNLSNNIIPGIADASVIQWQLGKSVGDTLRYLDDSGGEFFIVLVAGLENSIFQGNILISDTNFLDRFPSISGSSLFITESSLNQISDLSQKLTYSMQDFGLNLSTTFERLSEFNKIENTYLSIFLILGSFGILIGSLGIGLIVFRNIREQRKEFALLQAVGFTKKQIIGIINKGYLIILVYGIIVGIISAIAASLPSLIAVNLEIPYFLLLIIILFIFLFSFGSIFLTTNSSLKGNVNELLRNE